MVYDLVIVNGSLISSNGISQSDIGILDGKIAKIGSGLRGRDEISAAGMFVIPGGVDPHVHLEMPTVTTVTSDNWETGSIAAAFGGTTTVIDFVEPRYPKQPLLESFQERMSQAQGQSVIDFGLHMTLCEADMDTLLQIPGVVAAGMPSFKMYTTYHGFHLSDEKLLAAFEAISNAQGMAMVHSESDAIIQFAIRKQQFAGKLSLSDFPMSRPSVAEKEAVERVLNMADFTGTPVYIVHVSTQAAAAAITQAQQKGQVVWGETCPQYLLFDECRVQTKDFTGAKYVCCPPLRTQHDQDGLWVALSNGNLHTIGTDHCAFNFEGQKDLGKNSFLEIPSGMPGIELRLALAYTYGVKTGRLTLEQWVELCCTNPARLFGLYPRKGDLICGADADIVIFDPDHQEIVNHANMHESVDYTPYEGIKLEGRVCTTLLRGLILVKDGVWVGNQNHGNFVAGLPRQSN